MEIGNTFGEFQRAKLRIVHAELVSMSKQMCELFEDG